MVMAMAEQETTRLMNVTQAAKRLGVHPNTLRHWADKGSIPSIRLISGVRRFDPAVIESARREMGLPDGEPR
jgi:excisionase family DNA binding protein